MAYCTKDGKIHTCGNPRRKITSSATARPEDFYQTSKYGKMGHRKR